MIRFRCTCGKVLNAKDEAAGKRVRCPACRQPVTVPAAAGTPVREPAKTGDGLRLAEDTRSGHPGASLGSLCPHCHTSLPATTIVCTNCGLNLRTGDMPVVEKTFFEKIPWKTIARSVATLVAIVFALGLIYWIYNHYTEKQRRLAKEKGRTSSPATADPTQPDSTTKGAKAAQNAAEMRVHIITRTTWPEVKLADGFSLQAADRAYTAKEACELLRTKLYQRAVRRMAASDYKVVRKAGNVTLHVHIQLGWLYQKDGEVLAPLKPYVASCKASCATEGETVLWESKEGFAAFGIEPTKEQLDALAQVKSAKTDTNLAEYADLLTASVAKKAFADIPDPATLAKHLADAGKPKK